MKSDDLPSVDLCTRIPAAQQLPSPTSQVKSPLLRRPCLAWRGAERSFPLPQPCIVDLAVGHTPPTESRRHITYTLGVLCSKEPISLHYTDPMHAACRGSGGGRVCKLVRHAFPLSLALLSRFKKHTSGKGELRCTGKVGVLR